MVRVNRDTRDTMLRALIWTLVLVFALACWWLFLRSVVELIYR